MKRTKSYTLPKLVKGKHKWYIDYAVYNPVTNKMDRKRDYEGLNIRGMTNKERLSVGKANIIAIVNWLEQAATEEEAPENPLKNLPFLQLLDVLIDIKKPSIRYRSLTHYNQCKRLLTEYLKDKLGIMADQFTPLMAQGFSDFMISKKGYAGKTHNNHLSVAFSFFSMLIDREVVLKNPFKKIKRKPVDMGKNIAFSDKQRKEIREYLERNNHPLFPLVQFIYYCFIRPAELMQLQIKHIDFDTNSISIPANVSKNRKQGSVEMPKAFAQLCRNRYKDLDPELYICGKGLVPHPISVHRNRLTLAHKFVLEDLKIGAEHTLYSHKHTGVVAAAKAGVSPYDLMRQLRHSSLEQTMVYLKTLGLTPNTGYSQKQTTF